MSVLVWWAIPIGATLSTILWFGLRNRAATLMPQSSFLNPELPMAAAAHKTVPVQPRSDAAVELTEATP